jgi:hypothetical protein
MVLNLLTVEVPRTQTYHTRQDFSGRVISPSRFEPAIPARERPQTHALDRMASRIVKKNTIYIRCILLNIIPFEIIPICINTTIPPIALLILNLGTRRSSVIRLTFRPLYETLISQYPHNKRRSMSRGKCGRFGEGKNLLFFPRIEPPYFDCAARSPATKPPTVRSIHTNRTHNTHTCSPVYTENLHRRAMYELFPAT